jgi:hypothetical protein
MGEKWDAHYFWEEKEQHFVGSFQALPARLSDKVEIKVKTLGW